MKEKRIKKVTKLLNGFFKASLGIKKTGHSL